jgi:hypothetical protein
MTDEYRDALVRHLEAIRDYVEDPKRMNAEGMTWAEKCGGMWSQAIAALNLAAIPDDVKETRKEVDGDNNASKTTT